MFSEVFRIIDGDNREPTADTMKLAIQQNDTVCLPGNSLLIQWAGSELAIEAPRPTTILGTSSLSRQRHDLLHPKLGCQIHQTGLFLIEHEALVEDVGQQVSFAELVDHFLGKRRTIRVACVDQEINMATHFLERGEGQHDPVPVLWLVTTVLYNKPRRKFVGYPTEHSALNCSLVEPYQMKRGAAGSPRVS